MRIGIDARELSGRATGVGRYLSGLLNEWARPGNEAGRHEFVLYAEAAIGAELDARRFGTRLIPGAPGTWWEQVRLPRAIRQDHLDVWFGPAYTAPLSLNLPTVVTIHDVSFAAHPEWFRLREGLRRRWLTEQSAQRARAVVTVSEFSRREIVEHFGIAAGKIHVIPQGVGIRDSSLRCQRAPSPGPLQGSLRRIHLQPPPRHGSDPRLRAHRPLARRRFARHRRRQPQLPARRH